MAGVSLVRCAGSCRHTQTTRLLALDADGRRGVVAGLPELGVLLEVVGAAGRVDLDVALDHRALGGDALRVRGLRGAGCRGRIARVRGAWLACKGAPHLKGSERLRAGHERCAGGCSAQLERGGLGLGGGLALNSGCGLRLEGSALGRELQGRAREGGSTAVSAE